MENRQRETQGINVCLLGIVKTNRSCRVFALRPRFGIDSIQDFCMSLFCFTCPTLFVCLFVWFYVRKNQDDEPRSEVEDPFLSELNAYVFVLFRLSNTSIFCFVLPVQVWQTESLQRISMVVWTWKRYQCVNLSHLGLKHGSQFWNRLPRCHGYSASMIRIWFPAHWIIRPQRCMSLFCFICTLCFVFLLQVWLMATTMN